MLKVLEGQLTLYEKVILLLVSNTKGTSVKRLQGQTGLSATTIGVSLASLVSSGLLERKINGGSAPTIYVCVRSAETKDIICSRSADTNSLSFALAQRTQTHKTEVPQNKSQTDESANVCVRSAETNSQVAIPSLSLSLSLEDSFDTKEEPEQIPKTKTRERIPKGRLTWSSDHWEGVTPELLAFLSAKFPTLNVMAEIHQQEAYMVLRDKRYVDGNRAILNWLLHAVRYNKGDEHESSNIITVPPVLPKQVPIWTAEQDAEHTKKMRAWLDDGKGKEDVV